MNTMNNLTFFFLSMATEIFIAGCAGSGTVGETGSDITVTETTTTLSAGNSGATYDNDTELSTGYQVLNFTDVYIVDGNDKRIKGQKVPSGSKFSILYEGVKNYTLKDGKAFPAMALQLSDSGQQIIIGEPDLLASYAGGLSPEEAATLRATITLTDSMQPGNYICSIQITDKNNPEASIITTWSFDVK